MFRATTRKRTLIVPGDAVPTMSLQIEHALRDGFSRTFERNGLILVGVFVAFGLVNALLGLASAQEFLRYSTDGGLRLLPGLRPDAAAGPDFRVPMTGGGAASVGVSFLPYPVVVGQVIGGFTTVFGIATATRAYVQLRDEHPTRNASP